ncbi:c-type cytochrome [Sulfobacillus thermosulfidooxidans]|uniref:Cytochrome c domain-containing protein n=1 Tax=Sulfobacillus thermosulfidooxidans TaxID=28034 RepID=A0A2T2X4V6_SULTH|nr:c-type cytochrome [Sulfobacillus thermosulfidooxidans]PSR29519.1 MAG: hypothetical protein C7B47_02025 [Sulfobacillus thermosulfidooxidans]
MRKIPGILIVILLVSGCGAAVSSPHTKLYTYQPQLIAHGQKIFEQTCAPCHGQNGQGITGPALWGPNSAAAGFTHFSDLASFIQINMPQDNPGSLSPSSAQSVASFIWHQNHRT